VYTFCTQGSWLSTEYLRLLPGTYYVYGDVSFEAAHEELQVRPSPTQTLVFNLR